MVVDATKQKLEGSWLTWNSNMVMSNVYMRNVPAASTLIMETIDWSLGRMTK